MCVFPGPQTRHVVLTLTSPSPGSCFYLRPTSSPSPAMLSTHCFLLPLHQYHIDDVHPLLTDFAYGSERSLSGVVAGVRAILHYHVPKLVESSYEVVEDPIALWLPGWSVDAKMSGATRWKSDEDAANDDATFNVEGSLTFGYFPGESGVRYHMASSHSKLTSVSGTRRNVLLPPLLPLHVPPPPPPLQL